EDLATCARALARAAETLAPLPPPSCIEDISLDLQDAPAARHAVELALLDSLARRRGMPLARLLDPPAATQVPVGVLLSAREPAALAREARSAAFAGFGTVKLKVAGAPLEDDLARAAVVRDAAGPAVRLRLDANGG